MTGRLTKQTRDIVWYAIDCGMVIRERGPGARVLEIRRIRADEGVRLRAVRLRALVEAPTAFGQTLAEAQQRTDDEWTKRAREAATSDAAVIFVAEEQGQWHGMAGGFVLQDDPDTVRLASMWVDSTRRRSGLGAALVDAVVQWAQVRDAKRIDLWVTETNEPARALYIRQGFVATDRTKALPSNPSLREVLMVRELT